MDNTETKDEKLWRMAKKRAAFKRHLFSYVLVNSFLWVIWFFSGHFTSSYYDGYNEGFHFPWPLFIMFFWGIGLAFDFFHSYYGYKENMIEKEYRKLVEKKNV